MGEWSRRRIAALDAETRALRATCARQSDALAEAARETVSLRSGLQAARREAALRRFQRNCWACAAVGLLVVQLAAAVLVRVLVRATARTGTAG